MVVAQERPAFKNYYYMKEKFENRTFNGKIRVTLDPGKVWIADKLNICSHIISIVNSYGKKGYNLSLRQLYYQLVARDIIPNHLKVYNKVGSLKDDLAYSGQLDWDLIEDRGRIPFNLYTVNDIKHALKDTLDQYMLDRQRGQKNVVEVWTEKDAISNIIKRATNYFGTTLCINKGYTSSSAAYSAYKRFSKLISLGKSITVLYLGDHDSSGLDMIRDVRERIMNMLTKGDFKNDIWQTANDWRLKEGIYPIEMYNMGLISEKSIKELMNKDGFDASDKAINEFESAEIQLWIEGNDMFKVVPIGLTMDQINLYNPPANPAKITDPRAANYIREHGNISWEVDALEPEVIVKLVSEQIKKNIDMELFTSIIDLEEKEKIELKSIIEKY